MGSTATVLGFLVGAVAYVLANVGARPARGPAPQALRRPAADRGRAGGQRSAIAIGALLDGIPESVVLGLSLLGGSGVGVPVLAAIFISNLPEGLSSAAGMKRGGRSARYVFGVWVGVAVASGVAGLLGCLLLQGASAR